MACGSNEGWIPPGATQVEDQGLSEASGLEASVAYPGVYWAINDSGSLPILYRLDAQGRSLGRVHLLPSWFTDSETLAMWRQPGADWLLVGDVGDNRARRDEVQVMGIREPGLADRWADVAWTWTIRYPDGPRDVESMTVDHAGQALMLLSKRDQPPKLYRVPLPSPAEGQPPTDRELTAELVATLPAGWAGGQVTSLDLSDDGLQLVVMTYTHLHFWHRQPGQGWGDVLQTKPQMVSLPRMRKAEAMAWSADGRSVVVVSEHRPTPWWRLLR